MIGLHKTKAIQEQGGFQMKSYASASGSVMFVPEEIERTIPQVCERSSNDNDGEGEVQIG